MRIQDEPVIRRPGLLAGLFLTLVLAAPLVAATDIEVKGLFKGSAVLMIDGHQRVLKVGRTSPEGVLLVEANSRGAIVEVAGERRELLLSRKVGGQYSAPEKAEVRLPSSDYGHYVANGRINGSSVRFLVDTGASFVAISSRMADRIRLDYSEGQPTQVATANGAARGYGINLSRVSVGAITLNNVPAVVIEGDSPHEILLGNSFLSRVDMRVDQGVLILQSKY